MANRLKQAIARLMARMTHINQHQGFVEQEQYDVEDRDPVDGGVRADRFDRLQVAAAHHENRKPAQQNLLVGRQQGVTPVDSRRERLLTGGCGANIGAEQVEAVVQAFGNLLRAVKRRLTRPPALIASGMPSRRLQTCAIGATLSGRNAKPGAAACARSTNKRTA